MIQKDYILRMIEQIGKLLTRVMARREEGEGEDALRLIDEASASVLGIDFGLLRSLPARNIGELMGLTQDRTTGSMKCLIAGRLLKEWADIESLAGVEAGTIASLYRKSLELYLDGLLRMGYTELDMSEYFAQAREIAEQSGGGFPLGTMYKVFLMYTELGAYAHAETWLFRLKETGYPDVDEVGEKFYRKLESLDPERLRAGDMSPEEIEQGERDFSNVGGRNK